MEARQRANDGGPIAEVNINMLLGDGDFHEPGNLTSFRTAPVPRLGYQAIESGIHKTQH